MLLNKPCNEWDVPYNKILLKYLVSTASKSIIIFTVCIKEKRIYVGTKHNKLDCLHTERQMFIETQLDKFEVRIVWFPTNNVILFRNCGWEKSYTRGEESRSAHKSTRWHYTLTFVLIALCTFCWICFIREMLFFFFSSVAINLCFCGRAAREQRAVVNPLWS